MLNVHITSNAGQAAEAMRIVAKQIPWAIKMSLDQVAWVARGDLQEEMRKQFDRPTPFTLRSVRYKKATKRNLESWVYISDKLMGKVAMSMAELLRHQFEGGVRAKKRLEKHLERVGMISSDEYVVPGDGARFDQYGNMSRGQVQQALSQLRAHPIASAWKSGSERSKKNVRKAGRIWWSRGGPLPRGAYIVDERRKLKPLLVVVKRPTYQARIDINRVAAKTHAREFPRQFKKQLERAIASHRDT